MLDVMTARVALIDLYDTLVWSEWSELRDRMCERLGVEPRELLRAFSVTRDDRSVGLYEDAGADMAAVLAALGIDDPDTVDDLVRLERGFFATPRVHLHEDSLPVLRELRSRGVRTALVSNCSHSTRGEVERLGLDREMDAIVLSFEVGAKKPQPEIYLAALERVGAIKPSEAVFVDDQVEYCGGAKAVGIDTRLIVREGFEPPEGYAPDPDGHRQIGDLRELLDDLSG
jgi:HAD superfamily hydrolase (TIGR01509 family)